MKREVKNRLEKDTDEIPIFEPGEGRIPLFMPHVPKGAAERVVRTLGSRWIGQGPQVDLFEKQMSERFFEGNNALAVGSGTDALHLAYLLAGLKPGDEVLTPVFTCTATNIPLLYLGVEPVFVDVDPKTLNLDVAHARQMASEKTKAIICVHYAGLPCDMDEIHELGRELDVPVIEDAAHAVGATYKGSPIGSLSDFTMFSFQAIKHITTGDGGMLTFRDRGLSGLAESLRWFGIDRTKKQKGIWENDISEIGYKYQMTDIAASMGIAALQEWDETFALRQSLLNRYNSHLAGFNDLSVLSSPQADRQHAAWLFTVSAKKRRDLQRKLADNLIESNQVHYRNDRYSIFGSRRNNLPNMDAIEDDYLCLPLHTQMDVDDVDRICAVIKSGW